MTWHNTHNKYSYGSNKDRYLNCGINLLCSSRSVPLSNRNSSCEFFGSYHKSHKRSRLWVLFSLHLYILNYESQSSLSSNSHKLFCYLLSYKIKMTKCAQSFFEQMPPYNFLILYVLILVTLSTVCSKTTFLLSSLVDYIPRSTSNE